MSYLRAASLFALLGFGILAGCTGRNGPSVLPANTQSIRGATQMNATAFAAATSGVPLHVLTAAIVYGYSGTPTSVPLASMVPYVSWAQTDYNYAALLRASGIKVDIYENFWRNYSHDNPNAGYLDLEPGGAHAAAEARNCSGDVIIDPSYYPGYEADARSSAALGHALVYHNYRMSEYGTNFDAIFTDDTDAMNGIPLPCNYSMSSYMSAINSVNSGLAVPIFFSAFGAVADPTTQIPLLTPSNVIGGMCEICYAGWTKSPTGPVDYMQTGGKWTLIENAEAQTVALHKIYWVYARPVGDPSLETGIRKFVYASFLLTYDYRYAMLQVAFKTPHAFPVMPETGLVPMNPLTTASSVSGYHKSTGVYMREFGACYYHGVNKGKCAVVVNSAYATQSVPSTGYAHSLVLVGSGVLDGGYVTFSGGRVTSLPKASGAILFQ